MFDRTRALLERIEWKVIRWRLHWTYLRDSGRMLNRRASVEEVLLAVARGKRQPLTPEDCRRLAMYLGTKDGPFPELDRRLPVRFTTAQDAEVSLTIEQAGVELKYFYDRHGMPGADDDPPNDHRTGGE